MRKLVAIAAVAVLAAGASLYAADVVGVGEGTSQTAARLNAVSDIMSQIMIEVESITEISTYEEDSKYMDSFSEMITQYSRTLALEGVEYDDRSSNGKYTCTATIREESALIYLEKLESLSVEISQINESIEGDSSSEKNMAWSKTLVDLCYDFTGYRALLAQLSPNARAPQLPISLTRARAEYEVLLATEMNRLGSEIQATTIEYMLLGSDELEERLAMLRMEYVEVMVDMYSIDGIPAESEIVIGYDASDPETASEYLLAIEAGRKSLQSMRNDSTVKKRDLEDVASQTMDYLEELANKTFEATSGDGDLTISVTSYSQEGGYWVGKANLLLGEVNLQFAFGIPFEDLVGTRFNPSSFTSWNRDLMLSPNDLIELRIKFDVVGVTIGNKYVLSIQELEIHKKGGGLIYSAEIRNPPQITFTYGTYVDLGDTGSGSNYSSRIRQQADEGVSKSRRVHFYGAASVSGNWVGRSWILDAEDFYTTILDASYGGKAGVVFDNMKNGKEKQYIGAMLSYYRVPIYLALTTGEEIDNESNGVANLIGIEIPILFPLDSTLRKFVPVTTGIRCCLSDTWDYTYAEVFASGGYKFGSQNVGLELGASLSLFFARNSVSFGIGGYAAAYVFI